LPDKRSWKSTTPRAFFFHTDPHGTSLFIKMKSNARAMNQQARDTCHVGYMKNLQVYTPIFALPAILDALPISFPRAD